MTILLFVFAVNPFNEANFVPLPFRSLSVLSNPAGIGIGGGAELFFTYHPERINSGFTLGNFGFGVYHTTDTTNYELGGGIKVPGAFAIGYAHQFGDTTEKIFGSIGNFGRYLSLGYKTTIGRKKYMQAGIGVRFISDVLVFAGEMAYEGIDDFRAYKFGFIIAPTYGVKINFLSDPDWHWHAGIMLGTTKLKLGLIYSRQDRKFTSGIILSAQSY